MPTQRGAYQVFRESPQDPVQKDHACGMASAAHIFGAKAFFLFHVVVGRFWRGRHRMRKERHGRVLEVL